MQHISETQLPSLAWPDQKYKLSSANRDDATEILHVLERTADGLRAIGKNHWDGKHTLASVEESFSTGDLFLLRDPTLAAVATVTVSFSAPSFHLNTDLQFWANADAPAAHIRRMAVIPTHQHLGIASQLLLLAEAHAKARGIVYCRLDTDPLFPEIVSFYVARGYIVRGMRAGRPFFEKCLEVGS